MLWGQESGTSSGVPTHVSETVLERRLVVVLRSHGMRPLTTKINVARTKCGGIEVAATGLHRMCCKDCKDFSNQIY